MTQPDRIARTRYSLWALGLASILVLVGAGHWLQSQVHLNHDVSWFVHFSGWLVQGRALGTDIYSASLPMVWGLFMPPALLVHAGLLREPEAVRVVFWLYFIASAALVAYSLSREPAGQRASSIGWVAAFALVATLAPGFSFGQREHASVLFAMPYLAAAVLRLQGGPAPGGLAGWTIGVLAGIGFGLKPHFLAVPALVEALLLVRLGWRAPFRRPESLGMGLTVLAYVAGSALLLGEYLRSAIGLTLSTYWAYDSVDSANVLREYVDAARPGLYGIAIALVTRTWTWKHTVLLLAGAGYSASYFVQWKGFVYHGYPVLVCSCCLLGVSVGSGLARASRERRSWQKYALTAVVVLLVVPTALATRDRVAGWYAKYDIETGPTGRFRQAAIDTVERLAPGPGSYFFAFTTHPFPGFPTASYTTAEFSGRAIDQPFIAAYARLDEVSDPGLRARILHAARLQRDMVIEDLMRRPPDVVLIDSRRSRLGLNGRKFDDLDFYLEDPRFRAIWANYSEHRRLRALRIFVRNRAAGPAKLAPDLTTGRDEG